MGIFDIFKGKKEDIDWNSVKNSDKIYPSNSISVIMTQSESGKPTTGWVDMGYIDYEFKRCCPYNLQFSVEIDESDSSKELDFETLEDYFVNELKKGCIVHPVARVATDFGFIMDLYIDDSEFAVETLGKLYENPNKLVEFGCGFNRDPKWKEYNRITKLTE